jgi:predicted phosphodiesterase
MLVQIASDIHIEKLYPNKAVITDFITPVDEAEMLILAGDIGSIYQYEEFKHFFLSCKEHFPVVLYVPGNNEYYLREGFQPKSMKELDEDIIRLCKETDITLMNNSYIETDTHIIFGSTWWSHIPDTLTMRVYKENGKPINADDFNLMHNTARRSLNKIIETKGDKKLIVISHYCPTKFGTMNLHHKKSDFIELIPYYFSSSEKYLKGQVDVWIYGHTHVFRDFYFDNQHTRIISNADPRKKFFKKNFCVEF